MDDGALVHANSDVPARRNITPEFFVDEDNPFDFDASDAADALTERVVLALEFFREPYEPQPTSYDDRFAPLDPRALLISSDGLDRFEDCERLVVRHGESSFGYGVTAHTGWVEVSWWGEKTRKAPQWNFPDHFHQRLVHPDGESIGEVGDYILNGIKAESRFAALRFAEALVIFFTRDPNAYRYPLTRDSGAPTLAEFLQQRIALEVNLGWYRTFSRGEDDRRLRGIPEGLSEREISEFSELYRQYQHFGSLLTSTILQSHALGIIRSEYEPATLAHSLSCLNWDMTIHIQTNPFWSGSLANIVAGGIDNRMPLLHDPTRFTAVRGDNEDAWIHAPLIGKFGSDMRLALGLGLQFLSENERRGIIASELFTRASHDLLIEMNKESERTLGRALHPAYVEGTFETSSVAFWVERNHRDLFIHVSALHRDPLWPAGAPRWSSTDIGGELSNGVELGHGVRALSRPRQAITSGDENV